MQLKATSDDSVIATRPTADSFGEPLAIIGIGCRFPGGASSPDRFWVNLLEGKDCIIDVPDGRWDVKKFYSEDREMPGKMHVKSGGFLQERIDEFDALFFGISPREASALDPQQRILLEVSWEALEDAGIDPASLSGTSTGVFVGGFMLDNKLTQLNPLNRHTIGSDTAVGMTLTMLSNRLSYFYDLKGPSLSIDTACSSSLVALDQACRSIWTGESSLALVGGANIMHRPEIFIAMCKGGFLAPDGRSKAFDARANGYGRGEGAGIVVVKPLALAEKDGDSIYAIIRATGTNQDGRTDGITVPNPESQKRLIKKVCDNAAIAMSDIAYFEAHGTGTPVGDPIEISAIGGTIGLARPRGKKCLIGSVKGNIGHLEAASGVAALIKTSMCLRHEVVPPQANLEKLNEQIPFEALNVHIPRAVESIRDGGERIVAGINSFGYGGTNACAILEKHVPKNDSKLVDAKKIDKLTYILPLSAKSRTALPEIAENYFAYLQAHPECQISDFCYSASAKKAQLPNRTAILANSVDELKAKLAAYIGKELTGVLPEGQVTESRNNLVFVFTGMGPQWWKMGRELMETEPVFYNSVKKSDGILKSISGWSILEELLLPEEASRISDTQFAQTSNFVLQVALVELWRSWGIKPAAVVGHSVGEVTSAYVSGMLTFEQAMLVSFQRSRIQKKAANQGGMLAVGMSEADSLKAIAPYNGKVSIAAINAPTAITLAGDSEALAEIAEQLEAKGIFNRQLQVEVAYHSPTMDPLLDEIRVCLADLEPKQATVSCYSTVTGKRVQNGAFDAEYWCRNVREPVYFFKAIEQMIEDGYQDFIEIGPHPVLSSSIKECFAKKEIDGFLTASLNRKLPEQETIKGAVAELYCRGYKFNWQVLSSDYVINNDNLNECDKLRPQFLRLPTYPWQKESYWNDAAASWKDRVGEEIELVALGARQDGPGARWLSLINRQTFCHLDDHKVEGLVILAGATYVEAALSAYKTLYKEDACLIKDVRLHNAMVIDEHSEPMMQTEYHQRNGTFAIYGYDIHDKSRHTLHATGTLHKLAVSCPNALSIEEIKSRCIRRIDHDDLYAELASRGLQYGPYFQGIQVLWRRDNEVLAHIRVHDGIRESLNAFQLHPTILDACFQSLISAIPSHLECARQIYVPSTIEQVRYYKKPGDGDVFCQGNLESVSSESIRGNILICDADGSVLIEIVGLGCQALRSETQNFIDNLDDWTYQVTWKEDEALEMSQDDEKNKHILFIHDDAIGQTFKDVFANHAAVQPSIVYMQGFGEEPELASNHYSVDPHEADYLGRIIENVAHKGAILCLNYAWSVRRIDDDPIHLVQTQYLANFLRQANALAKRFSIRVHIYTLDAVRVKETDTVSGFYQNPAIGLARTASTEMPGIRCSAIDLCSTSLQQSVLQAFAECVQNSMEQELAYRGSRRHISRLTKTSLAHSYLAQITALKKEEAMIWSSVGLSSKTQMLMQKCLRRTPNENEIEIAISSVSHNSSTKYESSRREVCAKVVRVGSEKSGFEVGQEILAIYQGPLTNYFTVSPDDIIHIEKPKALSINDAPLLTAYLLGQTVMYELAKTDKSMSILVLGADTAVGQVLVNLAEHLGAPCLRVYHETSAPNLLGKGHFVSDPSLQENLLRDLSSRANTSHFDLVVNIGVDISCLYADRLLSGFGKWVDIVDNSDLKNEAPLLSAGKMYTRLNIEAILPDAPHPCPEAFKAKLKHVKSLLQLTLKKDLHCHRVAISEIAEQSTAHFPCIVQLTHRDQDVVEKNSASIKIKSNVTYLITGGFGGFGLAMAIWLAKQGARHMVLVSRSGAGTPEVQSAIRKLEESGVNVHAAGVDIADRNSLHALLTEVRETMPDLAGVFHAAGVLDDKPMAEIDNASFAKVMRPKALGAWHLHELTRDLDLDCFVLFSSISALIGNRNQANYVAANLFLDGLAQYRYSLGLSATSINWGALADVGMAANNPSVIKHLESIGIRAFSGDQALEAFASLLQAPVPQLGIFDVDWKRWKKFEIASEGLRFTELVSSELNSNQQANWFDRLSNSADAKARMLEVLSEILAGILKLSTAQLDVDTPINNFGLASLMAMDLQMKIRGEFKVDVSILELMKGNSLQKLRDVIAIKVTENGKAEDDDPLVNEQSTETIDLSLLDISSQDKSLDLSGLTNIDGLSEEELDELLKLEIPEN